jgi:uncharacterized DUF497 family protein
MEFEFNPEKSVANQQKRGINSQQAQAIWDDPDYIEIPLKTTDEARSMVIGMN